MDLSVIGGPAAYVDKIFLFLLTSDGENMLC